MSQPTFSIVVPVHNVRAYLRECIDSVRDQSFGDFELIAVDDASPDGSGPILDEYAATDPRVTVLHLERNVGLGKARDHGVDAASGKYLLFVDGDDTLTPGALAAIAERIAATGDPDILLFDYARAYWNGSIERNVRHAEFSVPGPAVFTVAERPKLLTLLMVVWNKAYRLDFVREHGFRFPVGYYEDLPWTYPTMLTAQRIALLDRVCYHYRQRRHGNILGSRNRKHFDIFGQYDLVFAYLDVHPDLQSWREFMFKRMTRHLLEIIRNRKRIDADLQHEFFTAFSEAFRRHRPIGYEVPSGRAGYKLKALERNDYATFQALDLGRRLERTVKTRRSRASAVVDRAVLKRKRSLIQTYYRTQQARPIDPNLAVYSAYWSRGFACNPAAIYEKARELAPHVRGVWVVRKDRVGSMPADVPYVELGSPEYYALMATAKYFINNVNFASNIVKRPGTVHVQTQHGTPLKTMGLGLQNYTVGAAGMNFSALMRRCDRWDYLISSNRFSTEVWERSFPNSYTTLEVGYPRNDRLVRATDAEQTRLRESLRLDPDTVAVLYTPTFRDWIRGRFEPPADLLDLAERLGDQFVILVRGHYLTTRNERLARLEARGVLRDVSAYPSIEDLMIASDLLLTDYSSAMFDYGNLDRPIVIFAPDWDTYVRVRGVNFDLLAAPPGAVATTQDELVETLRSGRYRDADADARRKEFIANFCELDDGHAAERVVRTVFLGEQKAAAAHRATGTSQASPDGDAASTRSESGAERRDRLIRRWIAPLTRR